MAAWLLAKFFVLTIFRECYQFWLCSGISSLGLAKSDLIDTSQSLFDVHQSLF